MRPIHLGSLAKSKMMVHGALGMLLQSANRWSLDRSVFVGSSVCIAQDIATLSSSNTVWSKSNLCSLAHICKRNSAPVGRARLYMCSATGAETLAERVEQDLRQRSLLFNKHLLLASVSGGVDSVALLRLLLEMQERWQLRIHVIHFNHALRRESEEEEVFVRDLCDRHSIPCHVFRRTDARGRESHGNAQERMRDWRRTESVKLLSELEGAVNASDGDSPAAVVLGHHADDQLETILLKSLRGVHISNLYGMRWREGRFLRPLLGVSKKDLTAYLNGIGQEWREDSSNAATNYKRNKVRLELLPLLQELSGGALSARLQALEEQSLQLRALLDDARERHLAADAAWRRDASRVTLSGLARVPQMVQQEVIHAIVRHATAGEAHLSHETLRLIREQIARDRPEWRLPLANGWALQRVGDVLCVVTAELKQKRSAQGESEARAPQADEATTTLQLGSLRIEHPASWNVAAGLSAASEAPEAALRIANLPADSGLVIRNMRNGDKFVPAWREDAVKLTSFLRGQRIPLEERRFMLLVCKKNASEVFAVYRSPEHYVARSFQAAAGSQQVLWVLSESLDCTW